MTETEAIEVLIGKTDEELARLNFERMISLVRDHSRDHGFEIHLDLDRWRKKVSFSWPEP